MAGAARKRKSTRAKEQEQIDKMSHTHITIDSLPLELLEKILQYLPHFDRLCMEKVCRKWREASQNTWRDIHSLYLHIPREPQYNFGFKDYGDPRTFFNVKDHEIRIRSDDLQIIKNLVMRIGRTIKKFSFDDDRFESKNDNNQVILSIISKYCRNIEIMQLQSSHLLLSTSAISKLLKVNEKLNSIKSDEEILRIIPVKNWKGLLFDRFDDRANVRRGAIEKKMIELIRSSPSLETFEMWRCPPRIIAELSQCKELKRFQTIVGWEESVNLIYNVPMLNRLTVLSIEYSSYETMKNIFGECVNLKILKVCHEEFDEEPDEFPVDEFLGNLLRLPKLEGLSISDFPINDTHLRSLTTLKHLTLTRPDVSEEGVLELIKNSEQLETLGISNIPVPLTSSFFRTIVEETRNRSEILEIDVGFRAYEVASWICKNSKIQIVKNSDFFNFLYDN